jgi:hypothetical protein
MVLVSSGSKAAADPVLRHDGTLAMTEEEILESWADYLRTLGVPPTPTRFKIASSPRGWKGRSNGRGQPGNRTPGPTTPFTTTPGSEEADESIVATTGSTDTKNEM